MLPLKTETVLSMLQPQLPDQTIGEHFVGIGWYCSGEGDDFCLGHQGVDEGFLAEMRVLPARGKAAAVIINAHGWLLPVEIFKAIGREYGWPATPLRAASIAMPPGIDYAGSYRSEHGVLAEVMQSADGLALRLGGQTPVPLVPGSELEFHAVVLNLFVHFEMESDRTITAMVLTQHGKEIRLPATGSRSFAKRKGRPWPSFSSYCMRRCPALTGEPVEAPSAHHASEP